MRNRMWHRWSRSAGAVALLAMAALPTVLAEDPATTAAKEQVLISKARRIDRLDAATGERTPWMEGLSADRPLALHPRGAHLIWWKHSPTAWELWERPLVGGRGRRLTPSTWEGCRSASYAPDGRHIAFWRTKPPGVFLMDRQDLTCLQLTEDGDRDHAPLWRPDGQALLVQRVVTTGRRTWRAHTDVVERLQGDEETWRVRTLGPAEPAGWTADSRAALVVRRVAGRWRLMRVPKRPLPPSPVDGLAGDVVHTAWDPARGVLVAHRPDPEGSTRVTGLASRGPRVDFGAVTAPVRGLWWGAGGRSAWVQTEGRPDLLWILTPGQAPRTVLEGRIGGLVGLPAGALKPSAPDGR